VQKQNRMAKLSSYRGDCSNFWGMILIWLGLRLIFTSAIGESSGLRVSGALGPDRSNLENGNSGLQALRILRIAKRYFRGLHASSRHKALNL